MSVVFEVVVLPVPSQAASEMLAQVNSAGAFQSRDLLGVGCFVYEKEPESPRRFGDSIEGLAEDFSRHFGKTLLVRYDSRVGYRFSALYANGIMAHAYEAEDEIFVLLNEDGSPQLTGKQFEYSELEDGEEYEPIRNAIELGLAELGWVDERREVGPDGRFSGGPWEEIQETMGRL